MLYRINVWYLIRRGRCNFNFKLGYLFSDAVKNIKKALIDISEINFVATHGQTI